MKCKNCGCKIEYSLGVDVAVAGDDKSAVLLVQDGEVVGRIVNVDHEPDQSAGDGWEYCDREDSE